MERTFTSMCYSLHSIWTKLSVSFSTLKIPGINFVLYYIEPFSPQLQEFSEKSLIPQKRGQNANVIPIKVGNVYARAPSILAK